MNSDYQPIHRDYDPRTDTDIMYRAMAEKNRKEREKIRDLIQKRLVRQDTEQGVRDMWRRLTQEEQMERVEKLQEVCNELIQRHPKYKSFKKARVFYPIEEEGQIICIIHWNGARISDNSGWGNVDREIPGHDIPLVIKSYNDRLLILQEEDEL